jgi:hypothetical protein
VLGAADVRSTQNRAGIGGVGVGVDGKSIGPR